MDFQLRKWRESDAESVVFYANNPQIAANLRNGFPYPYTLKNAKDYIASGINSDETQSFLRAIEINGQAAGSIGIFRNEDIYCKSAEIGYWLGEPFWGKGIMTEAIRQMCVYAFSQYDLVRIYAEPFAHNSGSRKALEKAGFILEGILRNSVYKNGKLGDSCIYALLKIEYTPKLQ